jgi:hypothetical protein
MAKMPIHHVWRISAKTVWIIQRCVQHFRANPIGRSPDEVLAAVKYVHDAMFEVAEEVVSVITDKRG